MLIYTAEGWIIFNIAGWKRSKITLAEKKCSNDWIVSFLFLFFFNNLSLYMSHQPVHNSGSSGYSSLNRNDHLMGMTSSSESLDNCSWKKAQETEEEISRKARPVSKSQSSQFIVGSSGHGGGHGQCRHWGLTLTGLFSDMTDDIPHMCRICSNLSDHIQHVCNQIQSRCWSSSSLQGLMYWLTCCVSITQRTFQEICKGIHLQKSQEQQTTKLDSKKSSKSSWILQ